jgi:hypothetical protein
LCIAFKKIENRSLVDTNAFHNHMSYLMCQQPIVKQQTIGDHRLKSSELFLNLVYFSDSDLLGVPSNQPKATVLSALEPPAQMNLGRCRTKHKPAFSQGNCLRRCTTKQLTLFGSAIPVTKN